MSFSPKRFAAIVLLKLALCAPLAHAQLGTADRDLVFVPITACRIFDTRLQGGALAAGVARSLDVTAVSDYAFQGGEASNCNGVGAAGSFAAVAINVTVINPNVSGTLVAWPFGGTEPPVAHSMAFAAGEVRSNFMIVKLDQGASANELSVKATASAHLTGDVVGYFKAAPLPVLSCQTTTKTIVSLAANGGTGNAFPPACPSGYLQTAIYCELSSFNASLVYASNACSARNAESTATDLRASARCCRVDAQ